MTAPLAREYARVERAAGEPGRCIHVGDRESDIYELFCTAHDLGTHFLVRTCVDRLAEDGQHTIDGEMRNGRGKGLHRVEIRDPKGARLVVDLELRYQRMTVLPPIGKQNRYPALQLSVIHARERNAPAKRAPIEWKLITDLPVSSIIRGPIGFSRVGTGVEADTPFSASSFAVASWDVASAPMAFDSGAQFDVTNVCVRTALRAGH